MAENKGPWGNIDNNPEKNKQNSSNGKKNNNDGIKLPPNVEFLFRKNGAGKDANPKNVIILLIVIAIALWTLSGFYVVDANQQGVVLRFGEYNRTTMPGLHYHLPAPIEKVYKPNVLTENRIEIGFRTIDANRSYPMGSAANLNQLSSDNSIADAYNESLMLTGDENIVEINYTVTWKIKDAKEFLFNVNNPENTIMIAAESAMRDIAAQTTINDLLTEKKELVQQQVQETLQKILDSYGMGVSITAIQMQKVDPPAPVIDAFYDVQRARADQERMRNEAQAYRDSIIPKAKGDAIKIRQDAEAYKEKVVNIATGEVNRFNALLAEYIKNPQITSKKMYLEAMGGVLQETNKIIIDPKLGGLLPVLPLNKQTKGEK